MESDKPKYIIDADYVVVSETIKPVEIPTNDPGEDIPDPITTPPRKHIPDPVTDHLHSNKRHIPDPISDPVNLTDGVRPDSVYERIAQRRLSVYERIAQRRLS